MAKVCIYLTVVLAVAATITTVSSNAIPPSGHAPLPPLSPQELTLVGVYHNFTIGVAKSIADNDIAMDETGPNHPSPSSLSGPEQMCAAPEVQVSSAIGLAHLLAVVNENIWKLGVPVFEQLLRDTPKTLPDSYDFILKTFLADPDVSFSSAIFTSENLKVTPALSKLRVEFVNADLSKKDSADTVNNYLNKFLGVSLEENYIPKGASISTAALALLIDTLHVSEDWPSTPSKVSSPPKFNGVETMDMVEIKGSFQVMESGQALEVLIPFKNSKRAISLILPNALGSFIEGELGEPNIVNYTSVRVQLPVFKSITRNSQSNLTTQCDFKNDENFLQLSDHVLRVSLSLEKFNAFSITGAQINNVKKFKDEKIIDSAQDSCVPPQNISSSSTSSISSGVSDPLVEKLIVFDRPFSWTLLDRSLGAIFSGSVISVQPKLSQASSAAPFIFGLESQLAYAKCL